MCAGDRSDRAALERFVIENREFERLEELLGEFNLLMGTCHIRTMAWEVEALG